MIFSREENRRWHNALPTKAVVANVLLWNDKGELLLVKTNYRHEWNLPGGVVDESESPLLAAVREVEEELGLDIEKDALRMCLVHFMPVDDGFKDYIAFLFDGGTLIQEQIDAIVLQADEIDEYRFAGVEEAYELLHSSRAESLRAVMQDNPPLFI